MADEIFNLTLTSTVLQPGQPMPREFTADGRDMSPPLKWADPPPGTQSLALVCDDPDAPRGTWTHWVIFNLPVLSRELSEGIPQVKDLPNGTRQGTNDFGKLGYNGPSPPPGKPHRYYFRLFALDTLLDLPPETTREQLLKAAEGHTLARGELMGTFGRPAK
jgi:Raf kinase inhibitor-like YbhB/YbcL family protein